MITNIEITDNTRIGKRWTQDLDSFQNGMVYKFKPGPNIIIGSNGCGKSTLMNLISEYTLCHDRMVSEFPQNLLELSDLFDEEGKVYDGIRIHHDWAGGVFKFLHKSDLLEKGSESILRDHRNFIFYNQSSSSSTGESVMIGLDSLFSRMFSGDTYQFPLQSLVNRMGNEFWDLRLRNLLEYYKETRIEITPETFEYTVLMDEPDRNLDIENIQELYGILSFHKPNTQIISVIHNPLLIYKLIDKVNIIEMTPGYLSKIKNFIRG